MDFVATYIAQRDDARAQFGSTEIIDLTTSGSLPHPRVSVGLATKIVSYWITEEARLTPFFGLPDLAGRKRDLDRLHAWAVKLAFRFDATIIDGPETAEFWSDVKNAVLRFRGISEAPSRWEIAVVSVKEAAADFGKGALITTALVLLVVAIVYAPQLVAALKGAKS